MGHERHPTRRAVIRAMAAGAAAAMLRPIAALAHSAPITRPIPSSGEALPVVGLGTWITFNVGDDLELREECAAVMRAFFREGGRGRSRSLERSGASVGSISSRCTISSRGRNTSRPCSR